MRQLVARLLMGMSLVFSGVMLSVGFSMPALAQTSPRVIPKDAQFGKVYINLDDNEAKASGEVYMLSPRLQIFDRRFRLIRVNTFDPKVGFEALFWINKLGQLERVWLDPKKVPDTVESEPKANIQ